MKNIYKINKLCVRRISLPRVDLSWKTSAYKSGHVDAIILEVSAGNHVGIGGTAAHPTEITADALEEQINGPVTDVLNDGDVYSCNKIRNALKAKNVHPLAFLAADLALYDLIGKIANLPCYVLLGGAVRQSITVVRFVGIKPLNELEAAARNLVNQGYRHLKVKIGTTIEEDTERIRILRQAFGDEIWIAVDANGAYTPNQAIALSRALEPYAVVLIEDPVSGKDINGMAQVTAESSIPIMADQCVRDSITAFSICKHKAAHIISVKVTKMGSLDECRRVSEICHAFGLRVHMGGVAGPSIIDAAQIHFVALSPNVDKECEVGEFQALRNDPTVGINIQNGKAEIGMAPGFGISITS